MKLPSNSFRSVILAVLLGAVCMSVFPSCEQLSVKENREECPSWLDIRLSGVEPGDVLSMSLFRGDEVPRGKWGMGALYSEDVLVTDSLFVSKTIQYEVPRGWVAESAVLNLQDFVYDPSVITVPFGGESPRLYGWVSTVACTGEFSCDTLVLGKQFCNVRLDVDGITEYPCPYSFIVKGAGAGWDRLSFAPVEGEFSCAFDIDASLRATVRLPRQEEDWPVTLDIVDVETGKLAQKIALLPYFNAVGYNWNARSLGDIIIKLSLAETGFVVTAQQWVSGDDFNISK